MKNFDLTVSIAQLSEKPIVARLLQLHLHDMPEFADDLEIDKEDAIRYVHLDKYWREPNREPLILRLREQIVGFALINDWSVSEIPIDKAVAEFFVMRRFRRMGVGQAAARRILQDREARWEVRVSATNRSGLAFWSAVLPTLRDYTAHEVTHSDSQWSGTIWQLLPE